MEIKGRLLVMSGGRVWWTWPNVSAGACRRAPGPMDDGRDGRGGDGCAENQAHEEGKAKAASTPTTTEFSPAPRTPGRASCSASKDDVIPPGSTVDKRSPQKPMKIKKEPTEQSMPVADQDAQSVQVIHSDVEVISTGEEQEDKNKAKNKGD